MNSKSKFKEKIRKRTRLEILKSWMSSFVITASAIIVAVVTIPSSPKAEIIQVQVFKNQVVYQVEVTDADNAIDLNTLEIILTNQFEYYKYPLQLGINIGEFSELKDGTTYQMSVQGSKGFGQEILATKEIVTQPNSGGAIIKYSLIDTQNQFDTQYEVETIIYDDLDEYVSVDLVYGVIGVDEIEPFEYYYLPVPDGSSSHILDQIFQMNGKIYVYLEATLLNSEKLILDEIYLNIPISFEAYYYIEQVTDTTIVLSVYPDFSLLEDVTYEFKLSKDGYPVATKTASKDDLDDNQMHYGIEITFDQLRKNTIYQVDLKVTYTNPYTLAKETQTYESQVLKTLGAYTYEVDVVEYDLYYEVMITVVDPNHNFQIPYYYVYEIHDEFEWFISSGTFGFTPMDGYKTVTFTIDKTASIPYRIDIGLRNEEFSYYYVTIYVILTIE
ncbi:MAG: hypothetical protein K9L02_04360 [Acholeplasmataceae bacterium]|nr:hypothetical protein [Acholeplasmataceae bacterium]